MKSFIKKLNDEGKIKIIEPNTNVSKSYLDKSEKSLISAKTLLKIEHYDDAIALVYFSMYYASLALLYKCGIKSENHTGTIILLKELFDIDNTEILQAKKDRIDKQYYVDIKTTHKETIIRIAAAEEFNTLINDKIYKIKTIDIQSYHTKATTLLQ